MSKRREFMKKTYQCKNCGNIYTSDLGVCPQCFTPAKKSGGKTIKVILLVLAIFVVLFLTIAVIAVVFDDSSDTSTTSSNALTSSQSDSNDLTIGSTLTAKGLNITLQKVEDWNSDNMFVNPKDGFKFIRAYFVLQNTNSSSRYLGSYDFTCYADNAKADMSIFGDDTLDLGAEVSGGRVLQGYIYYEVPINAQTIEIEYDSDWWGNKAVFKVR